MPLEILTPVEMRNAERRAIEGGTAGRELMERAGRCVAGEVMKRWTARRVRVLCGPGNNGGDGFVVARLLKEAGFAVGVAIAGDREALKDDPALMARLWGGEIDQLAPGALQNCDLIIDALFGTGLARPLEGAVAETVEALNRLKDVPVVAIDVPSGVEGADGRIRGCAVAARLTITFCRKKPAHLLLPGRLCCGETVVADIGISDTVVSSLKLKLFENAPELWELPRRLPQGHKYSAGHAVVVSGGAWSTGAARLAAEGAQRAGAGLVTVASPREALPINAAHLTSIMLAEIENAMALAHFLADRRRNVVLLGPGLGIGGQTRAMVRAALASGAAAVLDADALTSFEQAPKELFQAIGENPQRPVVMTPHAGEFARLFSSPEIGLQTSKVEQARTAAWQSGAVILYKGADTVVASPAGIAVINANAPPFLATAGSGDVLAGMVSGFLAQGMAPLAAAAAAAYVHGEAGNRLGHGLIAEDLIGAIPTALRWLDGKQNSIGAGPRALL